MIKEFQGKYRWLSNFWLTPIVFRGVLYPSVEHAYMSAKSDSREWKMQCANENNSPGKIKRASRNIKLVENWDEIKVAVMKECLEFKFSHQPLKGKLLATGEQVLEEGNTWGDKFWGVDVKTGKGQNTLGRLIMTIRKNLRDEQSS